MRFARALLGVALLVGVAACGYDTSATFNADGSVTVGVKILVPKSLMQTGTGVSMTGFSPADITKASSQLAAKYPGGKVTAVTEGDEVGALITVTFKTEKEAFAFMTQPSNLNPSSAASGSGSAVDLSNTGGLMESASHTKSGQTDTYTFKTQAQQLTSPSPDSASPITADELSSIFTITFSLTVPNVITSAPGALFTLDRKTAIWKVSLTESQTLSATTGPDSALALASTGSGSAAPGQSPILLIGVALVAILVGFGIATLMPLRRLSGASGPAPVSAAPPASQATQAPAGEDPASASFSEPRQ